MPRPSQAPSYDKYKAGKYARVIIDRKSHHLGKYGSPESWQKYRQLIAEWGASQGRVDDDSQHAGKVSVAEILAAYTHHAREYYGDTPRGHYRSLLPIIREMRLMFADLPATDFGPKRLKMVRQVFIDRGNCRGTVNRYASRVVRIFRWAAAEEIIPASIPDALRQVEGLRRDRSGIREGKPVASVAQSDVDATCAHLTPIMADMVRLQLLTGMRPGEVCSLTPDQINRTGEVWLYKPTQHKTLHHGKDRVVPIGPKAQEILLPFLLRPSEAFCFSPKETLAQSLDARHESRQTPMNCGNKPDKRKRRRAIDKVSDQYDVIAYRRAIHRACDRAGVRRWSPNQLRHTAATTVRERFGLDAVQAVLGHSHARVSEIYGELNMQKAIQVAREVG